KTRRTAPIFHVARVHDHIQVKFGPGFNIQEIITGFETPWLYLSNIPSTVSQDQIVHLLSKHGTVRELRAVTGSQQGTAKVRARFSCAIDAQKANLVLSGTRQWGSIITTQLPINDDHGHGATLEDTTAWIEWDAPSIVGYAGYSTEDQARNAIAFARTSFSEDYVLAHMYSGLPQMGTFTVRFSNLSVQTTKEQMSKYSKPSDIMWSVPNYTSVDLVVASLRCKLESNKIEIISFEVLPPPYRNGRVKAWIRFSNPAATKTACQLLHLRKPVCTGRTRVFAYHMKSLSYSISLHHYKKIQGDLTTFRARLSREVQGTTFTLTPGTAAVAIQISAVDEKILAKLKTEFEKLRGGEVVEYKGEVLWDRFFSLPAGKLYLRQLEVIHRGITIQEDVSSRRLSLFGQSGLRETVKTALIQKHVELLTTEKRRFFLGPLVGPFLRFEFESISRRLGTEKVVLDLWTRQLVVTGQSHDFYTALQAIQRVHSKQKSSSHATCSVCFCEVNCPIILYQCQHSYCRVCLINYLEAAISSNFFPLRCLGNDNNCSSLITVSLARQVLSIGQFDSLVEAAFGDYIHKHPKEFHYCPSPDCRQVYRPAPRGIVLQCPSCLLRICPQCHVEQHDGFVCPEQDGDQIFDEWLKTHKDDVKKCPSCGVPIERAEGCNHITCILCRTHICWVCMLTFPRGEGIYNHMRAEHGGIGNGP
ncbi:hypothetical protein C8J55DRAFT_418216, partial [Lentinula edodes]